MYYLTNHNFGKLLNGLYLDSPMNYAEAYVNYYSEYRLASFDSIFISLQKMKREH